LSAQGVLLDLATMEDDKECDLAGIGFGSAKAIFGQSSPHRRDVRLDGVLDVLYFGFPHIFYSH